MSKDDFYKYIYDNYKITIQITGDTYTITGELGEIINNYVCYINREINLEE